MSGNLGLLLSFSALLMWSVGDFYIQKSTRVVGIWKSLFYISFFGSLLMLPFVWKELPAIFSQPHNLYLLLTLSVIVLLAALFDFEALKRGKIAIIEPIFGLEIPITVALGILVVHDNISSIQLALIVAVFVGVVLSVMSRGRYHYHRIVWEKGVFLGILGTIAMALTNFLTGVGSQRISPLTTIWFINVFMTVLPLFYLILNKKAGTIFRDFRRHYTVVVSESIFDNTAWLSYAFAMTLIPISIATTISQSYIVITVLLGVYVNKEKLNSHQTFGVALALLGVLALSSTLIS